MRGAMTAGVLCPGPSLARQLPEPGEFALTIGVNRAVQFARCDYWAMLDGHTFGIVTRILGSPKLICTHGTFARLARKKPAARALGYLDTDKISLRDDMAPWRKWGMTTGIAAAAHLGAKRIEVRGADWDGTTDFDGYRDQHQSRTPERWERERGDFEALRKVLAGRGVRVERVH